MDLQKIEMACILIVCTCDKGTELPQSLTMLQARAFGYDDELPETVSADQILAVISARLDLVSEGTSVPENTSAALRRILEAVHLDMSSASAHATDRVIVSLIEVVEPVTVHSGIGFEPENVRHMLQCAAAIVRLFGATAEQTSQVNPDQFALWIDTVELAVSRIVTAQRLARMQACAERLGWTDLIRTVATIH